MRDAVEMIGVGGELLVSGPAVLWFATLAERAVHGQRLNGVRNPAAERWLSTTVDAAGRVRSADVGRSAVPIEADPASSAPIDPVTSSEAALMLGKRVRNVTDLCVRGSLESAQMVGGRWQIERAEVLARVERQAS